jgi:hypothetical protein
MVDTSDWPKPSVEELPELYEDLDTMVQEAETQLREHFVIKENPEERIIFEEASVSDYLKAIDANSEVIIAFFQKIAGLPDREFERQYGVGGVGSRLRKRKTSLMDVEDAQEFAVALEELMPYSLPLEGVLYAFYKSWEGDQRRFYRMRYESEILEFLQDNGYEAWKGTSLAGEPDIVIPESAPYEVIGEVRVIQRTDKEKRFKEFRSEAFEAAANFPEAKFVAVANLGKEYLEERDREKVRQEITKNGSSEIDAVIFHDERDELLSILGNWNVSTNAQTTLDDAT